MRYIGPFFRMNSLTQKEINGQLFYLSKEAVKTIVLQSRCGLVSNIKNYTNTSTIDINTNTNFSPLLCVYRKSSPTFIHSKNSNGFDEDTFKKDIEVSTNALMTLSLLELSDYYRAFKDIESDNYHLSELYNSLCKDQLEFYSVNLRNNEGVFIDKKNILENNAKTFNLIDKSKKFKFSDQAFMMVSYYLYALKNSDKEESKDYKDFSLEILKMFENYKENIYTCSLDEICKILLSFNILYSYDNLDRLKPLIIDFSDYAMNKFDDKDYYVNSLDVCALCALTLSLSYKNTNMSTFLDKSTEIINKLYTLYDEEKVAFYKLSTKKEIKYSTLDIMLYFMAFVVFSNVTNKQSEYRNMLSSIYKKFIINSGLIPSWPEAPTLDDYERYRSLSLNSSDMLDESYFRMPSIQTPEATGVAPMFKKYIVYNKRKDSFISDKLTFDSYKNFFVFYLLIFFFKDETMTEMGINRDLIFKNDEEPIIDEVLDNSSSTINPTPLSQDDCNDKDIK